MLIPRKILGIVVGLLLWGGLLQNQATTDFNLSVLRGSIALAEASDRGAAYNEIYETDEFGNHVSQFSSTSRFPLYALIKSENIYLYGMKNSGNSRGMILFLDDQATYFDWPDLAGRFGWICNRGYARPQLLYLLLCGRPRACGGGTGGVRRDVVHPG